MNDNILNMVDVRRREGEEALTVEGALFAGEQPLRSRTDLKIAVHHTRMLRLAREYMVDYDLARAAARANIPWDDAKFAQRDPVFITLQRLLVEELRPEDVITRAEILEMLKREATTAAKSTDRINAMNHLARIAGLDESIKEAGKNGAPVINITLNSGQGEKPMVNVTTSVAKPALPHSR